MMIVVFFRLCFICVQSLLFQGQCVDFLLSLTLLLFLNELSSEQLSLDYLSEALFILCLRCHGELFSGVVVAGRGFHQDILVDHFILRCRANALRRCNTVRLVRSLIHISLIKRLFFSAAQMIMIGAGLMIYM